MVIDMTDTNPLEFAKALADETRQKIMRLCCCEWVSVNDIVAQLNVTQPTVSHHLAVLREAGLVEVREQGKQTFYRLNQKRISDCCGQLMINFAPEDKVTRQLIVIYAPEDKGTPI
jgi:ArsR family transcriptional regulator, arsenate/arsenite/antimonite-responsive transcriptional repressor